MTVSRQHCAVAKHKLHRHVVSMQGLEVGIFGGIMMCAAHFAYEYSMLSLVTFTVLPSQSTSMLPYRHRQILSLFHGNMVAVSVSGACLRDAAICVLSQ